MLEQNLEINSHENSHKTITFEELWETDIDTLYEKYDLNSDLDQENDLSEENWLLF